MAHKILLADDSITIQKVVNLTFTDEGIDVVTVGNGELALKKLREDVFDLVLADIFMPGRNGYEVCEYIKAQPQLARVPVILLVGAFEPFDRSEASRVRADGHLTKPFESRILVETVKRMLAQVQPRPVENPTPASDSGWGAPPAEIASAAASDAEPPPYDPYASTAKINPFMAGGEDGSEQTMVIGSPFTAAPQEPEAEARFGQATSDFFQFNISGPLPTSSPAEEIPPAGYVTQPHELAEVHEEYEEQAAAAPGTMSFGGQSPEATPSWDEPTVIGGQPAQTTDFGVVETHTYEAGYVEERRDPLLESFDDVAQSTANVEAEVDPELVPNAQAEGESAISVGPVEGLTSAWDAESIPAAFRSEVEPAEEHSQLEANELEEFAEDDGFSARTQAYTPDMMRPFDAAEPEAEPPVAPAPAYDATQTQAYRFDLAPFLGAQQEAEQAVAGDTVEDVSEGVETVEEVEPEAANLMSELPIEIVDAPEMPETAPPPPKSLPTPDFNFDPTRTQQYEFGLPPFEPEAEDVVEAPEAEEAPAEAASAGTGTGDLDFTPPPPPISDEPLEAAFADTAPLRLSRLAEASAEMVPHEESDGVAETPLTVEEEPVAEAESVDEAAPAPAEVESEPEAESEPIAAAPMNGDSTGGADLLAVPSDIIDEIVRRTVERMSDDVIREIAWEVVPDLAARMIKKHLSERQ
jgi:CheY-like chemotaxis protein